MTKILLVNIPNGQFPTDYPPVGISRVMEGINPSLNCELVFYNLDLYRPQMEVIAKKIREVSPQIIGMSAVLTHAYVYVKELSLYLNEQFPEIIQVLGGEMASISNILLHKTKIEFCVTGESEPTFSKLISKLEELNYNTEDKNAFNEIKGLVYILKGMSYFTGYEDETNCIVREPNYELLSKYSDISHYIQKVNGQFYKIRINKNDINSYLNLLKPFNKNKNMLTLFASKGCVGTCTYCHRFFKGYRTIDPDEVINYIEYYRKKYDAGMIQFAEENFGSNKRMTAKIVQYLKDNNLNWAAGAVRASTIDEETIKQWRDSGCVNVNFGIESCSDKILEIMGKRITAEQNIKALDLCKKNGVFSIIGLVIGMPGETEQTIEETISALIKIIPDDFNMPLEVCTQWFQAVPGTEGYEYARNIGFIGYTLDEEEKYMETLYEVTAQDIKHYLNFTDYEKEEISYWRDYILIELTAAYIKKHGYFKVVLNKNARRYKLVAMYMLMPRILRKNVLKYAYVIKDFGVIGLLFLLYKKLFKKRNSSFNKINGSLKKINEVIRLPIREDDVYTYILRFGR